MLTINLAAGSLSRHERAALERAEGVCLLPLTIADDDGGVKLMYLTEGFVTFREYDFHGDLYRMFRAVKGLAGRLLEVQDMLLGAGRVFKTGDRVFISARDCDVRMAYGAEKTEGGVYGVYAETLIPVLAELSAKAMVTGAKPAMTQLAKKIRSANPDYGNVIRIIESVERRWNYMQPVGP
ncbi:MAG: hypothetical protein LBJ91_01060 [Clostridiales Family XIII bacterium]|nr:hypothetical protein [Clostridiales Family XIII bacterium]